MDYRKIEKQIADNGEPGVLWLDVAQSMARAGTPDNRDVLTEGVNPCGEILLESGELCTLVETYLPRHESLEDFQATLKCAYLYSKVVTLLGTHWERSEVPC